MDPLLVAAIKAGKKIVHLVTVELDAVTIRWTDGGFVVWAGEVYQKTDPTFGALDSIGEITDGVDDDASPVEIVIAPPTLTSIEDLTAADAQGGRVMIHLGALDGESGSLVGQPYDLTRGWLDRPIFEVGSRLLTYEILSAEALALEPNEEQRQSDAFHQSIWPGELGYEHQTDGTKIVFWRDDDPNNAIGFISPRRKKGGDPKEFNYDPDAGLPFPFGRTPVAGTLNYRVGFGPTNRYNAIFCTVAASGPIKAFVSSTFNDQLTTFGSGDVATSGDHSGAMWMQRKLGTQPQSALTTPAAIGYAPSGWGSAYGQSGRACFALTMFENSKKSEFGGGVPTVLNIVDGLYGYDPRAPGASITNRSTWPFIDNGVIADLNWVIGRWEGASIGGGYGLPYLSSIVGGLGAPLSDIEMAAFIEAADAVPEGWQISACPTSADDKQQVREDLLQAAGAEPARRRGLISCISNVSVKPSVVDVTNADTAGDFAYEVFASRLDRKNTAFAKFFSPHHRWEMTPIAPVTNAAWRAADKGKRSTSFDFPTVPLASQTASLCYLKLANRRELQSEVPFKPYMLMVESGECFTWQEPQYLLVGVKAQVRKRSYDPMKCSLKVTFRSETDSKYAEAGLVEAVAPPPYEPGSPPVRYSSARIPIRRTSHDGTTAVSFATASTSGAAATSIDVLEHKAWFSDSPPEEFEAETISGLTPFTSYAVFGRDGDDYVAIPSPADTYFSDPAWVFIGWQYTADGGGSYPAPTTPPPGSGGSNPTYDAVLV